MEKEYEYTLDDCDCRYCLYFDEVEENCLIETCCCLEEKQAALLRISDGKTKVFTPSLLGHAFRLVNLIVGDR